jgi:hypothetical protein
VGDECKISLIQWGFKPRLNEVKPPADASDFLRKFIERARRRTGRPSQAKPQDVAFCSVIKIRAQIRRGEFDNENRIFFKEGPLVYNEGTFLMV